MDIDIEATCHPDYDRPRMQKIVVVGKAGDGREVCTLDALRWAEPCFDITEAGNLVAAFDEHSAFAYGLAEEIKKRKRAMKVRYGDFDPFVSGFIGIVTIRTEPDAVGNRHGLELIRYLRSMHAGMAWYAGLQAASYDLEHDSVAYRTMRRRLTSYYASDPTLGFEEDAPRASPGLMTAFWDQE